MTKYNSAFLESLPFSDKAIQIALAAGVPLSYTIPGTNAQQYRAEFSWPYNANVWVSYNATATTTTPGTITTTANTSIVLRPDIKYVRGGDVLSFISSSLVTDGGMELLSIPGG